MENHPLEELIGNDPFDKIIIGGGPAGATVAIYLARAGFNICLIEKKDFPRETLCGEFLSHEVASILSDLSLFNRFQELGPGKISRFKLYTEHGKPLDVSLPFTGYGLRRSKFDSFLLDEAKASGAMILQPALAWIISFDGGLHSVLVRRESGDVILKAAQVIEACGRHKIPGQHREAEPRHTKTGLNGIKFHVNTVQLNSFHWDEIHIYAGHNIYCGVNKVDADKVTVCFLEKRNEKTPSARKHLLELAHSNSSLAELLGDKREEIINEAVIYGTGNINFGLKTIAGGGIYRIGDAARVISPLAGDGIAMAMQSARLLAGILTEQREKKYTDEITERIYRKKWNRLFRKRIFIAAFIQKILLGSSQHRFIFALVQNFPNLINYLILSTRGNAAQVVTPVLHDKTRDK